MLAITKLRNATGINAILKSSKSELVERSHNAIYVIANVEIAMATELELKMLARLRAHEVLIQHLLRLIFKNEPIAIRDFSERLRASLDTSRLPDLDVATSARLPYETQEALARVLDDAIRDAENT